MVLASISGIVSTIVAGIVILGMIGMAVRRIRKNKKQGGCGCGCSGCSTNCHAKNLDDMK
ncbi:MAG: FeoB-associated Cys-rich membrane protein [Lachnoclostridium sp.]